MKKSAFKRLTKGAEGAKILLLALWAYYALSIKKLRQAPVQFDFFEIAIRAISRGYIPKFLQGGQINAYY